MQPEDRHMERAIIRINQNSLERLKKKFQIVLFIALREQPFTMFPHILDLEELHGVDLGTAYRNDKACRQFIGEFAQKIRGETVLAVQNMHNTEKSLYKYNYHSMFFDGTTDRTISERELVYVKVLDDGIPKMKLFG